MRADKIAGRAGEGIGLAGDDGGEEATPLLATLPIESDESSGLK